MMHLHLIFPEQFLSGPPREKILFGKWILYPSSVSGLSTTNIPLVISIFWLVLICPITRTINCFSFYTVKPRRVFFLLLVLHCCSLLQFHRLPNQMLLLLFSVYKKPRKMSTHKEHSSRSSIRFSIFQALLSSFLIKENSKSQLNF